MDLIPSKASRNKNPNWGSTPSGHYVGGWSQNAFGGSFEPEQVNPMSPSRPFGADQGEYGGAEPTPYSGGGFFPSEAEEGAAAAAGYPFGDLGSAFGAAATAGYAWDQTAADAFNWASSWLPWAQSEWDAFWGRNNGFQDTPAWQNTTNNSPLNGAHYSFGAGWTRTCHVDPSSGGPNYKVGSFYNHPSPCYGAWAPSGFPCGVGGNGSANGAWGCPIPAGDVGVNFISSQYPWDLVTLNGRSGMVWESWTYSGSSPTPVPFVPGTVVLPAEVPDPFPQPLPWRDIPSPDGSVWQADGSVGFYGGYGAPPSGPPALGGRPAATPVAGGGPDHIERPPGRGEKEKKRTFSQASKAFHKLWHVVHQVGNFNRYTNAFWNALPWSIRRDHKYARLPEKLSVLYANADRINITKAAEGILNQMARDRVFGKIARMQAASIQANPYWNKPMGFTFGGKYRPGYGGYVHQGWLR